MMKINTMKRDERLGLHYFLIQLDTDEPNCSLGKVLSTHRNRIDALDTAEKIYPEHEVWLVKVIGFKMKETKHQLFTEYE